jgi:hypothetical protein
MNLVRLGFAALALFAIAWQLALHLAAGHPALNFFSYYTNLSNLFACGVLIYAALRPAPSALRDQLRFLAVVNMTLVGVVFALLLRNTDLGDLLPWVNVIVHYVMPVVLFADWLVEPPASRLGARQVAIAMVFPIAWLAYTLLRGPVVAWYPYPFLNPATAGGSAGVAAYSVGITIAFVLMASALRVLGNGRRAQA